MEAARAKGLSGAMLDRLALDEKRIEAMARGVEEIAALADPIGTTMRALDASQRARHRARARAAGRDRHHLREPAQRDLRCRRAVPQVRQRRHPARRLRERAFQPRHSCLPGRGARPPPDCRRRAIQLVPTTDRAAVGYLLSSMTDYIDVVVPRGGKSLVARVQHEARVPVIGHLEGVCHVYVDRDADLAMARAIVKNAKLRRTGVCGSAETLLVDAAVRGHAPGAGGQGPAGRRLRSARRRRGPEGGRAREAGHRAGLVHRVSRRDHRRAGRRRRRRRHRTHRASTARRTPRASSPRTPPPRSVSSSG